MKILQIGDMHLGAKLSGVEKREAKKEIRSLISQTVDEIEQSLKSEEYDGLILTGDIFDSENISYYWINKVSNIISTVLNRGGFVVYATGNHDCFVREEIFNNLPPNTGRFKLFNREKFEHLDISIKGEEYRIHGIGYESFNPRQNISSLLPDAVNDKKNILVFHGEIINQNTLNAEKSYMYSDVNSILNKDYDYTAVGHTHMHEVFENKIAYSGCTFPQGFDELGQKGVLSVCIDDNVRLEFIPVANYHLARLDTRINANTTELISTEISKLVKEHTSDMTGKTFFKIKARISGIYVDALKAMEIEESVFGSAKNTNSILFKAEKNRQKEEVILPDEIVTAINQSANYLKDILSTGNNELNLIGSVDITEDISDNMPQIVEEIFSILKEDTYVD